MGSLYKHIYDTDQKEIAARVVEAIGQKQYNVGIVLVRVGVVGLLACYLYSTVRENRRLR